MSVVTYDAGDAFIFRVVKSLTTNPDNKWANSYEFRAIEAGGEGNLLTLGEILVDFEAAIHQNVVNFERLLVSTWEPDSKPYDPTTFISTTLTAVGQVGHVTDLMPLDKALSVARIPLVGRFGHIFYRGVLQEGDVIAPAGKSVLEDKPGFDDTIQAAISSSGLGDYLSTGAPDQLVMAMIGKSGPPGRNVMRLIAQGVSTLPQDHAWFNRTTPTTP